MINPIDFKVVFVTAYLEYAITALRFSATDYLLKPVLIDELIAAVNKVRAELSKEIGTMNLQKLLENLTSKKSHYNQLVISNSNGFKVIDTDQIILCEADGYCTHFMLSDGEKITSSKNLKHYEELLSDQSFIRVHNSFMLNMGHIKSYSNQGEIRLSNNLSCPLGNAYRQKFLVRFKTYR
jgi:two-component system LytT family response regulator